ncbi:MULTISPECIES: alanine racemase [unclassified Lentimicrobium]|uniref:alanine racemase n=1 Tax=unclassified Lentimicrobium TaxID=2677434 RepID=UPI0015576DA6|nr:MULTISPECIES: alanine racemase [unclassified Lentimicrobium]NPD45369.1 alanine racemase [Lentimicrobium sp. S6]NPD85264.1 alanine racemase [Lentimicrobium sp. L6]
MTRPTLTLNTLQAKKNIQKMKAICEQHEMDFRPHFKTHQSPQIAEWFRQEGIDKCTCSSLDMAYEFVNHGWKDICVAIPLNVREMQKANLIASQVKLSLCVDHLETLTRLAQETYSPIFVFIEIDTGYGRSGVYYEDRTLINSLLKKIDVTEHLEFSGFLSHTGNSYHSLNAKKGRSIFEEARKNMEELKKEYMEQYPQMILSMGDTPSSNFADKFDGIDEWRPGNFIFYDFMQYAIGACAEEEIAVRVKCPVIGIYLKRTEIAIYGGGVHLSKDSIQYQKETIYGWAHYENESIANGFPVISLSQEHGIIRVSEAFLKRVKIGDILDIIPIHSCMTADLNAYYLTEDSRQISKFRTY